MQNTTNQNMPGADYFERLSAATMNYFGRSSAYYLEFISDRLQEDAKFRYELMTLRDPTQIAQLQAKFVEKAMAQYSDASNRMVQISSETLGGAFDPPKR